MLMAGSVAHLMDAVVAARSWKLWAPCGLCGRCKQARSELLTPAQAEKPHRYLGPDLCRESHWLRREDLLPSSSGKDWECA